MKLIIVESPHKAKTISKYLGSEFTVMASGGHISDLPQRRLGIDVSNDFKPEYEVNADKADTIRRIKTEVKRADAVYLATDPDREGEAISWHLKNVLDLPDGKNRIEFNEVSKRAILAAIDNPRALNADRIDSQQARRVLDRLVGYKVSPVLSGKIRKGLSAGRVQSVALRMIVEREREIRAFKPEEYWNIFAFNFSAVNSSNTVFKSAFTHLNGKKTKVTNKAQNDNIVAGSKAGAWSVESVKRAESRSRPAPPFTTSTLQQEAVQKLGVTADSAMRTAQALYEGVEITGEGQVALVTYIRTDSVRVSDDAKAAAKSFITSRFGKDYYPAKPNFYASKKGAQDAHEAIRPITLTKTPEDLKGKVDSRAWRLYKLIFDRFVASQMSEAVYDTLTVSIISQNGADKYGYTLKGKTLKFAGYTAIYSSYKEAEEDNLEEDTLPNLQEGERLTLKNITSEQKFTKPPARFTDATLVKALEENGIGRPSTYASIISTISKRQYTEKDGKFIQPTELGEVVTDHLCKYFPDILDVDFTAGMEEKLDKIEDGEVGWTRVLKDFYPGFEKELSNAMQGERIKMVLVESDEICEKCGKKMVIRDGRFGKFLACPGFPACKNSKPFDKPVSTCPKCQKDIYKRRSKKGKTFYGCSGYPACDFLSWDPPAPHFCPECEGTMKIIKSGYACTKCKHTEEKSQ